MANEENLKPFQSGQSGNPNGRPKGIPNAKTRYRRLLELTQKKTNPVTGEIEEFTVAEQMDMKIFDKALKGDLQAYREIMDRLEGKPSQFITNEVNLNPVDELLKAYGIDPEGVQNGGETNEIVSDPSENKA